MAVPNMHPTTPATKPFPDRAIPGSSHKPSSMAPPSQQSPSRPTSAAPNSKADKDRAKSPLTGEELLALREADQGSSTSPDAIRGGPAHANMPFNTESASGMNPPMRGPPTNPASHAFMPHPFSYAGMNMNVPSQQAFGPAPPMQYFSPNFSPTAYTQAPTTTRSGAGVQKYPAMDPKFMPSQNQLVHPSTSPQLQSMARRPSNYFVTPSMSQVQSSYAPRGWMPNSGPMLGAPMQMQTSASSSMQNPALYQPAMLSANPNPGLLTPPGSMPAAFNSGFPPTTVSNSFGFPTPPEQGGPVVAPDIPPPVPSVYPDPAYSNINNCIYNPKGTTNVYIRGLRPETTDEDLLHMVRPYGTITSTKAIIDTSTKLCKG